MKIHVSELLFGKLSSCHDFHYAFITSIDFNYFLCLVFQSILLNLLSYTLFNCQPSLKLKGTPDTTYFYMDLLKINTLPAKLCWCELDSYWSWGWELFGCIDENVPAFRWKSPIPGLVFVALQEPFDTSALDSFKAIWLAPYAQDVSSGMASSSWWLKLPPLKIQFWKVIVKLLNSLYFT